MAPLENAKIFQPCGADSPQGGGGFHFFQVGDPDSPGATQNRLWVAPVVWSFFPPSTTGGGLFLWRILRRPLAGFFLGGWVLRDLPAARAAGGPAGIPNGRGHLGLMFFSQRSVILAGSAAICRNSFRTADRRS